MSCFQLPSGLCREIEQLLGDFWWGESDGKKRVHWMSWRRMCRSKGEGGLGFRDLELFNLALLAKQGWRLVMEPDSLVARLLKAKYYPNSTLLQATIGYNPSFTWRSLMSGRRVLEEGLIWSIGNGSDVNVWDDRWIPRPTTFKVVANARGGDPNLRVIDLIDWDSFRWDAAAVRELLLPCDAEIVLNMRLVDPGCDDQLMWHMNRNGLFSVRSAYYMQLEAQRRAGGDVGQADRAEEERAWKALWKLKTIPRVTSFVWRAAKEILPCKFNLARRKITEDDRCDLCGKQETGYHALYECYASRSVWKLSPGLARHWKGLRTVREVFQSVFLRAPMEERQRWTMVLWHVWGARNKRIFEHVEKQPKEVFAEAERTRAEFEKYVDHTHTNRSASLQPGRTVWERPRRGYVKFNCDASVAQGGTVISFIGRNDSGELIVAGQREIDCTADVEVAEAEAIRWAVNIAKERGMRLLQIESDCISIIAKLKDGYAGIGVLGRLVEVMKAEAATFEEVEWGHIRREGNKVAHGLAAARPVMNALYFTALALQSSVYTLMLDDMSLI